MALQLFKIADILVESPATSVTFSNIPSGYTDLKIVCSAKSTNNASTWTDIQLRPNGSTTSFSGRTLLGYGTTVGSNTDTHPSAGQQSAVGSNIFSSSEVYIPNYNSSVNKSWSTDSTTESNDSASSIRWLGAYLWSNTAAITSITLASVQHSFDQNSTFTLYGVL
jgi:hypothetical protein